MNTKETENKSSYVNFRIGKESYAITIFKVLEILQSEELTVIPDVSDIILGMFNFRGTIVPIIDMHKRFNLESSEEVNKMIIVVDILNNDKEVLFGLLVDQVTDVVEFGHSDIREVPDLGDNCNAEFLEGFVEMDKKFLMVINLERVLKFESSVVNVS
jgi:purine-binding chemotaxis protein CheW